MAREVRPEWVATAAGMAAVADACRRAGRFALDTEADSLHSYFHKVCLVQVTADGRDWVIDPLALSAAELAPLWEVAADPVVTVVMHGADYDIRVLDRDYGVRLRGLEDTQVMAQLLGEPRTGLAVLLEVELGVRLDKKHQRADWGERPLAPELVEYAAHDTAHLETLADLLRRRLKERGRWTWAVEECAALEAVHYQAPAPDELAFERLKGGGSLRGAARDRLFGLFRWREQVARTRDVPPFKVLGAAPMVALSEKPPANVRELGAVPGLGPRFARQSGREVLAILAAPPAAPARVRGRRRDGLDGAAGERFARLTRARDQVAEREGLPGGLLCPRALLLAVASTPARRPDRADLERAGLVGWRLELLGEPFHDALANG